MKKIALSLVTIWILSTSLFANKVIVCKTYSVSAKSELSCDGDFNGKITMVELYKRGWRFVGEITSPSRFILVLEKRLGSSQRQSLSQN